MEDVSDYRIISSPHKEEVEATVGRMLREGWRLHGALLYNDLMWVQALIK